MLLSAFNPFYTVLTASSAMYQQIQHDPSSPYYQSMSEGYGSPGAYAQRSFYPVLDPGPSLYPCGQYQQPPPFPSPPSFKPPHHHFQQPIDAQLDGPNAIDHTTNYKSESENGTCGNRATSAFATATKSTSPIYSPQQATPPMSSYGPYSTTPVQSESANYYGGSQSYYGTTNNPNFYTPPAIQQSTNNFGNGQFGEHGQHSAFGSAEYAWMRNRCQSQMQYGTNTQATSSGAMEIGWCSSSSQGRTRTREKYRMVYSDNQRLELEKEFITSEYISTQRKAYLSRALGLSERQIKIWFQNRRAKKRKQLRRGGTANGPNVSDHPPMPSLVPPHAEFRSLPSFGSVNTNEDMEMGRQRQRSLDDVSISPGPFL